MPVLNHHIVAAREKEATARYFSEILGLDDAVLLGEFAVLRVSPDTTLDFIDTDGDFDRLHYAFLVTEGEFDEIFARIKQRQIPYWSDPMHNDPGAINTWDDGRGVYFDDPDGHRLEIITRPTAAEAPRPSSHIRSWPQRSRVRLLPETSIDADVLEHFDKRFVRDDFVEIILDNSWPE